LDQTTTPFALPHRRCSPNYSFLVAADLFLSFPPFYAERQQPKTKPRRGFYTTRFGKRSALPLAPLASDLYQQPPVVNREQVAEYQLPDDDQTSFGLPEEVQRAMGKPHTMNGNPMSTCRKL
jgi:hypothetical protein